MSSLEWRAGTLHMSAGKASDGIRQQGLASDCGAEVPKKHPSETEKRQTILEEATLQFLQHGYDATTVDRIAAAAKVGKQAIYQYFESKEDLFAAVIGAGLGQPMADLPLDMPIVDALEHYALSLLQKTSNPSAFGLMRTNIMAYRHFPALAAELHHDRRRMAGNAAAYFATLQQQGRVRCDDMDMLDLATRLGGLATQGVRPLMGFDRPSVAERTALARCAVRLFLFGCQDVQRPMEINPLEGRAGRSEIRPDVAMRLRPDRFDHLCTTALDLFLEHGFDGMSLDDLVAATGVSRATIYRQFGSKEGLFKYLLEEEIGRSARHEIAVPDAAGLLAGIQQLARAVLERHLGERSLAMYRLLIQEVHRVPELARRYYDVQLNLLRQPMALLFARFGRGAADDYCVEAFHILATFGMRYLVSAPPADQAEIQMLSDQAASILLEGVVSETGSVQ